MVTRRYILTLPLLALLVAAARAEDPLHTQLPQDTLAFVELNPAISPKSPNGQSALLDMGVQAMQSVGILTQQAGEVGDALSLASAAGSSHSCVALLDADLVATPAGDLQCNSVQLAWVIDTGGQARDMVARLTQLLAHLSTRTTAQQSIHKTPEEKREYVEFHDTTWPAWLTLAWTQQGRFFILTVGSGAMDHYLAGRPVGGVPWLQTVAAIDKAAAGQGAEGVPFARVYVAADAFRQRYPDAMVKTNLGKLFTALDLARCDSALMTARVQGRAISMDSGSVAGGLVVDNPWTVPLPPESPLLKLVPAEATAYLVLNIQWPALYARATALLDAALGKSATDSTARAIDALARQQHVNVQADILAHLQPLVLVHDAPPHPLRLPLMVTAVAAADPDSQGTVRDAFDALLTAAATGLDRRAAPASRKGAPAGTPGAIASAEHDLTHLRIRTDKDGVRYLQFGLVGPAWQWVQNRLVFSWSPAAVRYNTTLAPLIPPDAFTPPHN